MGVIRNPADIITHILREEVQHNVEEGKITVDESIGTAEAISDMSGGDGFEMAFVVYDKQINSKKLIEGIASNTRLIPYIKNSKLNFRSIKLSATEEDIQYTIDSSDVISYTNSRTQAEKIYTKVTVNYHFDYALKDYQRTTLDNDFPDSIIDIISNANDGQVFQNFGDVDPDLYLANLGLKADQELVFDAEYIRKESGNINNDTSARNLHQFLLLWNCNQHNILKLKLPLRYIKMQIGDYIAFDKMINGVKLFGEDYSLSNEDVVVRNGQQILPIWMVTKTKKTLTHLNIELMQIHNCDATPQDYPPVALINNEIESYIQVEANTGEIILDGSMSFEPNIEDEIVEYDFTRLQGSSLGGTYEQDGSVLILNNPEINEPYPAEPPYIQNHTYRLLVTSSDGTVSEPAIVNIQRIDYSGTPPPPVPVDPRDLFTVNSEPTQHPDPWQVGDAYSFFRDYSQANHQKIFYMTIGEIGNNYYPRFDWGVFDIHFDVSGKPPQWELWEFENNAKLGFRTELYRRYTPYQTTFGFSFNGGGQWITVEDINNHYYDGYQHYFQYIGNISPPSHTNPETDDFGNATQSFRILEHHFNTGLSDYFLLEEGGWISPSMQNEMLELSTRIIAYVEYEDGTVETLPELGYCELHIRSYPETIGDAPETPTEDEGIVA